MFAIYNVHENAPSFLNDKTRYFPNLPDDLRSGVPKDIRSVEAYWMFDENTVCGYGNYCRAKICNQRRK